MHSGAAGIGAIFDWDGVVIDSSAHHEESWERLAREVGRPLPAGHFKRSFGMKNEWIMPNVLGWDIGEETVRAWSLRKEELYREVVRERGVELLPGARGLLEGLAGAGVPAAVGSSTHRENIACVLAATGVGALFRALVTSEDVRRGKPDPEVFLTAAARLGVTPGRCVVFEDAHVGIEAARAAGMRVVALATTHPRETLAEADRVVGDLSELAVPDVLALLDCWAGPADHTPDH